MDALSQRMSDGKGTSVKGQENGSLQGVAGEIRRLHHELKSFLPKSEMATEGVSANTNAGGASQFSASNILSSAMGAAVLAPMSLDARSTANDSGIARADSTDGQHLPEPQTAVNDELEDMANAAFKNSPYLGLSSSGDSSNADLAEKFAGKLIASSDPLEELLDKQLLSKPLLRTESPAVQPEWQQLPTAETGTIDEAASEAVANLADDLMAAGREQPKDRWDEVSTEFPGMASAELPPENIPPKRRRAKHEQNAEEGHGEEVPGHEGTSPQIKSPKISGNIPPPKRQT
jgi:hypothetical protein